MDTLDKIIKLIEDSKLDDIVIEKDLELPRSTIYKWKHNINKSYNKYIAEIASYFNVSAGYLVEKIDNDQEKKEVGIQIGKPTTAEIEAVISEIESFSPEDVQKVHEYARFLKGLKNK